MIPSREQIYNIIGYCGRYGHQSRTEVLSTPVNELSLLQDGIQYWLDKEKV